MKSYISKFAQVLIIFLLISCGNSKMKDISPFEKMPPFTIAEAYYQDWIAGVQGGGAGTNIFITFTTIDEDVVIQNIFFQNQKLEAKTTQQNLKIVSGHLINNNNKKIVMDSDPLKEAANTPKEPFPFDLNENEAVLEYWLKGGKKYFKITDMQQKPLIPYPSANKTDKN